MTQFVILSILIHIWMVTLFGDASGDGHGRRGGTPGTGFSATLQPSVASVQQRSKSRRASAATVGTPALPTAVTGPAETQSSDTTIADRAPIDASAALASSALPKPIEPLPVIAVEVETPKGEFVVPGLSIAPIQAPVSTAGQAIVPMPANDSNQPPPRSEGGFAIFVAPINEPSTVVESARLSFATPTLQSVQAVQSTKSLQRYAPQPVEGPKIAPTPPAALAIETSALPVVESPAVSSSPPMAALPVAPLERISVLRAADRALDTYAVPVTATVVASPEADRPVSLPTSSPSPSQPGTALNSAAVRGATDSKTSGTDAQARVSGNASATAAARANVLSPGLSSLLPVMPTPPVPAPLPGPKLDLDSLRQRARELSADGAGRRTLLPFPAVAQEAPKRNIEKIFDKALSRPNCKDEYASLGLAAVVPLVRDAVKGDGCKW